MTSTMQQLGELLMQPEPKIIPAVGVHPGVPERVYQRVWDAASNSRLTLLRRSPAHLKASIDNPDDDATPAKILGRAIHKVILEPDAFASLYVCAERCSATTQKGSRCTNNGSIFTGAAWFCGVHASSTGGLMRVEVLSPADYATCLKIRDSVFAHTAARKLLKSAGQGELSLAWNDRDTGILCKARIDFHSTTFAGGALLDVKSTTDAGEEAFARAIDAYGYHRQGALYLEGAEKIELEACHFVNIAVEKEPPYAVALYRLDEDTILRGANQLHLLKARYAECLRTNTWPAYSDKVRDISLPEWSAKRIDQETSEAA